MGKAEALTRGGCEAGRGGGRSLTHGTAQEMEVLLMFQADLCDPVFSLFALFYEAFRT